MADDDAVIGPALPPHLRKSKPVGPVLPCNQDVETIGPSTQDKQIGPMLPPNLSKANIGPVMPPNLDEKAELVQDSQIGPMLPPHLCKANIGPTLPPTQVDKTDVDSDLVLDNQIGPMLPPHLLKAKIAQTEQKSTDSQSFDNTTDNQIGPALPPHLQQKSTVVGPALPPNFVKQTYSDEESSSEEETFGPLPDGMQKRSAAHVALEERALQMKLDKLADPKEKQTVREEWMLELPEVKAANFGLGPRQFRSKQGPDLSDRSSWTEVGGSKKKQKKEKEVDLRKDAELANLRERDSQQEAESKKHKRHKESLVEMHQKKMKSEKEKEPPTERRPFNRETDLQVNRFDEAQKKAVLKKAQLLDDRFSSGQSKFL